jgi:hypothetical protein
MYKSHTIDSICNPKWRSGYIVMSRSGDTSYKIKHYKGKRFIKTTIQNIRLDVTKWSTDEEQHQRPRRKATLAYPRSEANSYNYIPKSDNERTN